MDRNKVKSFFDGLAEGWDTGLRKHNPDLVDLLLRLADIPENARILDIGCGTGVLVPHLERYAPAEITGLDISECMIAQARAKFPQEKYRFLAQDAYTFADGQPYQNIFVYNAFPHFDDPARIIAHLSGLLASEGRLMVCHSASRQVINGHHEQHATEISLGLPPAKDIAALMDASLEVDICIDTPQLFAVSGRKKIFL